MNKIIAMIALFVGSSFAAWAGTPPDGALWSTDKSAAAAASPNANGTRVTAYLRQQDGIFLEVDLSAVEGGNFGKLGRRANEYDRFETRPVEWLPRQDGLLQVVIRTRAWKAGQRYTVSEPLVLRSDGTVIWR